MSRRQSDPMRRLPVFLIMSFFVFLAFGCGGGGGGSSSDSDEGTPSISTQGVLGFGTAVIPNAPARVLTVINNGTGDLAIGQIALQQAGTPFAIAADGCSNQSIAPSGSCQVTVQLNTNGYEQTDFTNTLSIPSNAPGSPLALAVEGKVRKYFVSINEVKKGGCPTVELLVSVVDGSGASVSGLQNFFRLNEDGTPQTIIPPVTYQSADLSVVLLLDYSKSITSFDLIQNAAKAFIDQLKASDEAAVLKFAKTTDPPDFTFETDKSILKGLVDAPFTGDTEGTILYDVVYSAIDALRTSTKTRRAVVVLSDGLDNGSGSTLNTAIDLAVQTGIPVFAIAITDADDPRPQIMKQLADETYGAYFEAPSASVVGGIYAQIAGILSDQYLIQYDSASSGGSPIDLDVFVEGPLAGDKGDASRDAIAGCP